MHEVEVECFAEPWSLSALENELSYTTSICLAALDENDNVVGYVSMRHIINEGHISNIAVTEKHRRQGVGALLLTTLTDEAIKREMIGLTLEVRQSNHAAIALYEKFGFKTEGHRKNYYSYPTEDAVIMWHKISTEI